MKIHEVIRLRNVYGGETTLNDLVNLIQGNKIYRCPKCGGGKTLPKAVSVGGKTLPKAVSVGVKLFRRL